MRVSVVRPGDLGAGEAELWAKFQRSSPATVSPFLSLTFAQAVGRSRPGARVAVIEEAGQTVAFLPFELTGPSMAMPIGHPMNNLQGFVGSAAALDARAVIRQAGLRGWRFVTVPASQPALRPYHYPQTRVDCPVVDLTGGYQAYFTGVRKSITTEISRRRRALQRKFGSVTLDWHSPRPREHLQQLLAWKSGMYGGTRELFTDPTAASIVDELAAGEHEDCQGAVSVLSAGDRPIAIALWLTDSLGLAAWFASYDAEFRRSSPGTMILFEVAEEAARRGMARIDLSAGQDGYKFKLANDSYPVAGGAVWAHRSEEVVRRSYRWIAGHRRRSSSPSASPQAAADAE
jgi:CelD/BcsL family acetyltransferase involved in cellulose biosynthesis